MSELVVRRLLIDLETPLPRHWCAGDTFRTAFFNALSMSFPVGEQFFIDSVRNGLKALPAELQDKYKAEVQGFIGQEATHRRIHSLFNGHLEKQGLVNDWAPRAEKNMQLLAGTNPLHALAITAANEHFTAILAEWMLRNHDMLDGCEPRLKTMWLWHCAEESEHKNTAFDVYTALGGSHEWRIKWFRRITYVFLTDTLRQTVNNLRHDGTLWQWRTWKSAATFLFGRRGLVRQTLKPWRDYLRQDFHPNQQGSELSARWLSDNSRAYTTVGIPA
ncbi:metal-dependent hydrolase [Polaromonas sp.]|uniref:metal-dependent hydrolase n=1 Tax=Polaromonas sp. TaxID=1869339 RepID=UPI003C90DF0A